MSRTEQVGTDTDIVEVSQEDHVVHRTRVQSSSSDSEAPLASKKARSAFPMAAVACIAALQFGYNTAVMSGALAPLEDSFWPCSSGSSSGPGESSSLSSSLPAEGSCEQASSLMEGLLVSSILVGALIGALLGGPVADLVGRIVSLAVDEVLFVIGAVCCAVAPGPELFIVGRVVLGLGVGIASTVPSMYASEIAPVAQRGQVGVLNQLMICLGIFAAYLVCALLALLHNHDLGWRLMVGAPILIAVVHLLLLLVPLFRTESPRWLLMKGRRDQARTALRRLRGKGFSQKEYDQLASDQAAAAKDRSSDDEQDQQEEPEQKEPEQKEQKEQKSALYEAFHPARPIIIATGLMFWQQITGINAVLYYLSKFLTEAGMTAEMAGYMSIVVGAVNTIMTFVTVPLIERLGRKPLLLVSLGGMTVMLAGIGLVGVFAGTTTGGSISSVVLTILFVVAFAIGMGCCPWAVINELFTSRARGVAVSLSMATNWVTNLLVTLLFPVLIGLVPMGYVFIGFAVLGVLAIVFVALLLPETKGRTVEEIVSHFRK